MTEDELVEKALTRTARQSKEAGGFHRECAEAAIHNYRAVLKEAGLMEDEP